MFVYFKYQFGLFVNYLIGIGPRIVEQSFAKRNLYLIKKVSRVFIWLDKIKCFRVIEVPHFLNPFTAIIIIGSFVIYSIYSATQHIQVHISNSWIHIVTCNKEGIGSTVWWDKLTFFFLFRFLYCKSFETHQIFIFFVSHWKL